MKLKNVDIRTTLFDGYYQILWFKNGELDREAGPAIQTASYNQYYYSGILESTVWLKEIRINTAHYEFFVSGIKNRAVSKIKIINK